MLGHLSRLRLRDLDLRLLDLRQERDLLLLTDLLLDLLDELERELNDWEDDLDLPRLLECLECERLGDLEVRLHD